MGTEMKYWPEWKVVEKLGEGSFGAVYKCCKTEHDVEVYSAIKVINVPFDDEDEATAAETTGTDTQTVREYLKEIVDSCMDEIRMLASVKGNNNIVSVEDFKCVENESGFGWTILIRMELLNSFTAYMNKHSFTEKEVLQLGIDICSALQVCEAKDIVHRDIKPANILMTEMGTFKLGDFGIARKLEGSKDGLSSKGTRSYMAPEVSATGAYGSNVDVYSLGIVMYQLLNNNRIPFLDPYAAGVSYTEKKEAVAARMSGKPLPDPCDASDELAAVLRKACAFDPEKRYASASQMKEDLEDILYVRKKDRKSLLSDTTQTDVTEVAEATDVTEVNEEVTVVGGKNSKSGAAKKNSNRGSEKKFITAAVLCVIFVCGIVCGLFGYIRLAVPGDVIENLRDGEYDRAYAIYVKYYEDSKRSTDRLKDKLSERLDALEEEYAQGRITYTAAIDEVDVIEKMNRVNLVDRLDGLRTVFEADKSINDMMQQAQNLYMSGDYVKAIELYQKVITEQGEITPAVQTALTASENAYRVVMLEEAGYLAANGDKNAAIAKIDEALLVLPNDVRLLERKNKINEATVVPATTVPATTQPATTVPATTQPATTQQVPTSIVYVEVSQETTRNTQNTTTTRYSVTDNAKIIGTYYVSADTPDHEGVNMRTEPRNTSTLVASLAEGTAVEITNVEQDSYTYCKYNGKYGWILTEFLTSTKNKTITITVLNASTKKSISNVKVSVAPNDSYSSATAKGTTDRNGQVQLGVPEQDIRISLECSGYTSTSSVFNAGGSQNSVTMYMTSNQPVEDSFTKQYNAALNAYDSFLQKLENEDNSSNRTACADVNGDDIPDLIVHNSTTGEKTFYSYSQSSDAMITLLTAGSGKGYSLPVYYNVTQSRVICTSASTGGSIYTVFRLSGTQSNSVKEFEYKNGKFTTSATAEYYIDNELVSEEIYNSEWENLLEDYIQVQDPPSRTRVRVIEMLRTSNS